MHDTGLQVLLWYIPGSGGNPGKPTGQVFNADNAGFLLYKGLDIDNSTSGNSLLYAANFGNGKIGILHRIQKVVDTF